VAKWGRVDTVINNAGTSYRNKASCVVCFCIRNEQGLTPAQPTLEVTIDEFQRCFDVNVKSIFWSVGAVVPQMQKQGGGSIINISSIGSVRPRPGLVWYNSTKGAVSNVSWPP